MLTPLTDLAVTPIAETIRSLWAEGRSGELQVRSGKVAKMAFFDCGRPVFAASNLRKERLGEVLVALGRISSEQFQSASLAMKKDKKTRFGDALYRAGVMGKDEIGSSVAHWAEKTLCSFFALETGAVFFEERGCPIPPEYRVSLSVPRILHDGIKSMTRVELVLAGIGDLDHKLVIAPVSPFDFDTEKCSPEETYALGRAKNGATVRELSSDDAGLSFVRLRAVYGLLAAGILQEEATYAPPPVWREDAVRQEVDGDLGRSAALNSESWLGVSRTAPHGELAAALERKIDRYKVLAIEAARDEALKTDIEIILGRAASMLRLAQRVDAAGEAPPRASSESKPTPPPAAAPTSSMGVEHYLMQANVGLMVGDFWNAIQSFGEAVKLQPDDAALRLRLALAMACWGPTAKQAESQFQEAIRLEPDNAEAHFQFGLYYKVMKVPSRSIGELRAAVRLNPRHRKARAELDSLAPTESALSGLKKLFK